MKYIILLSIICSFAAYAVDDHVITQKWQLIDEIGKPGVISEDHEFLALSYKTLIGFANTSSECSGDNSSEPVVWKVNNTPVNMIGYCISDFFGYLPATDKGRLFILRQFKTKKSVTVAGHVFSAKNFTKVFDEANSLKEKAI